MQITEVVRCHGHPNITGKHRSTFEITKEEELTPKGTCILGTAADRGAADLSQEFKQMLADDRAELTTVLTVDGVSFTIKSQGSSLITLNHPTDLVWRRSSYVCGRTIGIYSDHVAETIPREITDALKTGSIMEVKMTVTVPEKVQTPSVQLLQVLFHTD